MAEKKFSEFTLKNTPTDVSHIVGYTTTENVRISPTDFLSEYLPLAGGTMTGDTIHIDNEKSIYGTNGDELQIYHDDLGSSWIKHLTTGDFKIQTEGTGYLKLYAGSEQSVVCIPDGNVELYNGNGGSPSTKKFETTTDGVKVFGGIQDSNGSTGTAGQVLSSTGTALDWIDASSPSNPITGTGVVGQLPYFDTTNSLTSTNEFTFTPTGSLSSTPTIGIGLAGAANTKAALEIASFLDYNGSPFDYYLYTGTGGSFQNFSGTDVFAISIHTNGRIMSSGLHVYSDQRIKKDISVSDSKEDLETLNKIEISNYKYIDEAQGNREQKKVIAQQVMEHYPLAVSTNKDVVPDVYKKSTIKDGAIADEITGCDVGDLIKLIYPNGDKELVAVLESNGKNIKVESQKSGEVFVYGKEVKDYHSVDYDAIAMLNVSATKELYKIIKELKDEIRGLKTSL